MKFVLAALLLAGCATPIPPTCDEIKPDAAGLTWCRQGDAWLLLSDAKERKPE